MKFRNAKNDPPEDSGRYEKPDEFLLRIKGDDPRSGWISVSYETAIQVKLIASESDGTAEWLDESTPEPSDKVREALKESIRLLKGLLPHTNANYGGTVREDVKDKIIEAYKLINDYEAALSQAPETDFIKHNLNVFNMLPGQVHNPSQPEGEERLSRKQFTKRYNIPWADLYKFLAQENDDCSKALKSTISELADLKAKQPDTGKQSENFSSGSYDPGESDPGKYSF